MVYVDNILMTESDVIKIKILIGGLNHNLSQGIWLPKLLHGNKSKLCQR